MNKEQVESVGVQPALHCPSHRGQFLPCGSKEAHARSASWSLDIRAL